MDHAAGTSTFLQFLILFGSATVVATLFHKLRLPAIIGFLVAGVLIGPHGFKLVSSVSGAETLTEIGTVLLMFTIGLEFSYQRLRTLKKPFFFLGSSQVILTITSVALLSLWLMPVTGSQALVIGMLASVSCTAIVLKLLQDSREMNAPFGATSIGVTVFQDVATIPMILALPILAKTHAAPDLPTGGAFGEWVLKLLATLLLIAVGTKYVVPALLTQVVKTRSREVFFFCILFLCFGVAFTGTQVGLSVSLGAFVAGLMIADSAYARQATAEVVLMRDNFLGLFFISIGMLLDPMFLLKNFHYVLLIGTVIFGLRFAILYGVARLLHYPASVATITAVLMNQTGEFSFIMAESARRMGILGPNEFQYFLSISFISLAITPFLYSRAARLGAFTGTGEMVAGRILRGEWGLKKQVARGVEAIVAESHTPTKIKTGTEAPEGLHTIIIGYGIAGRNLGSAFKALNIPYKVIELNYDVVRMYKRDGVDIHFGDASRDEVLHEAALDSARLVVLTVSGAGMTQGALSAIHRLRPDVPVIVRTQYLREVQGLTLPALSDVVVAEFETSMEVLARALTHYGVSSHKIHEFMKASREELAQSTDAITDSLRRSIELPTWQALSSIRPLRLEAGNFAIGKSLGEMNVRALTGASVVSVFRESMGTAIPNAEFVFEPSDIVHLIGSPESLESVEALLTKGSVTS